MRNLWWKCQLPRTNSEIPGIKPSSEFRHLHLPVCKDLSDFAPIIHVFQTFPTITWEYTKHNVHNKNIQRVEAFLQSEKLNQVLLFEKIYAFIIIDPKEKKKHYISASLRVTEWETWQFTVNKVVSIARYEKRGISTAGIFTLAVCLIKRIPSSNVDPTDRLWVCGRKLKCLTVQSCSISNAIISCKQKT